MAEAFKQTQNDWCETWLTDADLYDAVAVVGPERQRIPFIRAHLATISKPLKAALYGDWLVVSKRYVGVHVFHQELRWFLHVSPAVSSSL